MNHRDRAALPILFAANAEVAERATCRAGWRFFRRAFAAWLAVVGIGFLSGPVQAGSCMEWVLRSEVSGISAGPGPQFRHCMAYHPVRGTVLLFSADERADLWEYDGTRWALIEVEGSKPRPRMDAGLAYRTTGNEFRRGLTLIGGYSGQPDVDGNHRLEDVWRFEFEGEFDSPPGPHVNRGRWVLSSLLPEAGNSSDVVSEKAARANVRLADSPRGLLVLGGLTRHRDQVGPSSYEEYDGPANFFYLMGGLLSPDQFLNFSPEGLSPGRGGVTEVAVAYDSLRKRVVHYGGVVLLSRHTPPYLREDDTLKVFEMPGERSNSRFYFNRLATLLPRHGHRMVYDSARDRLVVFGGSHLLNGSVNPGAWESQLVDAQRYFEVDPGRTNAPGQLAPELNSDFADAPSARWGHDMVYDARRGVTVMYGGFNSLVANTALTGLAAETWELVARPPEVVQQPAPLLDLCTRLSADGMEEFTPEFSLGVRVSAPGPVTYRWWYRSRDRMDPYPGGTNATLVVPGQQFLPEIPVLGPTVSPAGTYQCEIRDSCGNVVWSELSEVRAFGTPFTYFYTRDSNNTDPLPEDQSVLPLCPGDTAYLDYWIIVPKGNYLQSRLVTDPETGLQVFEEFINGPEYPVSHQWFRFGAMEGSGAIHLGQQFEVPGATNSGIILSNMTSAVNGYYRLRTETLCSTAYSAPIEITAGVWIKSNPRSQTNLVCEPLSLKVVASGKGPLTYQWRKDGFPLSDNPHLAGVNGATLSFARLRYLDDAAYDCVISDACHTVTSRVARVSIIPNPPFLLVDTNGPDARARHGMAYDSNRGVTVMFGGIGDGESAASTLRNDTWEYDGRSWVRRATATAPSGRMELSMCYDSHRRRVVLFGGTSSDGAFNTFLVGDTWEFDGTNWVQRFPANSPSPRTGGAFFYDPVRRVSTLYGGDSADANPRAGEILNWDGSNWTQQMIEGERPTFGGGLIGSPPRPKMVWDARRGYAILPPSENPVPGGDLITWIWNGSSWAAHPSPFEGFGMSPSIAGSGVGMVYDTHRGEAIYWSGDAFDQEFVWRWNGTAWMRDTIAAFVGFHLYAGAAYDEGRNSVVMFGGSYAGDAEAPQGYSGRTFERVLADEPVLLRPPVVLRNAEDGSLTVRLVAAGAPPLTYEWLRDGAPIPEGPPYSGASTPTLSIANSASGDPARFRCVIRGACGMTTTGEVTLAPAAMIRLTAGGPAVDGSRTLRLEWNAAEGVLESAPTVGGPWSARPELQSPQTVPTQDAQHYFRVRLR